MPITKTAVEALSPGEAIWDDKLPGFGARRQKHAASYILKYRVFGRQQLYTLGQHGPLTPDTARKKAKRILGQVADGKDPAAEKADASAKAADTLGKVIDDYLVYAEKKQRHSSFRSTKRHLLKNWKPLHSVSVFHITRRQVASQIKAIEQARGKVPAIQARLALSGMFNWAIREGYEIPFNPVQGTNKPKTPKARSRVLSDAELVEIWNACGDDDYGRIIRLLMLTLQRRDEVGGLKREEIAGALWTIPEDRAKNHREHQLPLTDPAKAIISTALRSTNREFAFGRGPRREGDPERGFSGWSKSKLALDLRILNNRRTAGGEPSLDIETFQVLRKKGLVPGEMSKWTLHTLRHTGDTVMHDRLGVMPHIVEAVLNHVSGHKKGVAGVYNHAKYLDPMREALDRWAAHVVDKHKIIVGNILPD
jgi:integrase